MKRYNIYKVDNELWLILDCEKTYAKYLEINLEDYSVDVKENISCDKYKLLSIGEMSSYMSTVKTQKDAAEIMLSIYESSRDPKYAEASK